jgi:hypothetical protein
VGQDGGKERAEPDAAADRENDEQADEGSSRSAVRRRAAGFGHVAPLAASFGRGGAQNSGAIPGARQPPSSGLGAGSQPIIEVRTMPARKAAQPEGSEPAVFPAPSRSRRRAARPAEPLPPPPAGYGSGADADAESDAGPAIEEDGSWIQADAVEVRQGAIGRVDATEVAVTQGAIGAARADRISVQMGALGAAMGREISISQGGAGSILAGNARVDQAFVRTLVAQHVEIHRPSAVLFLIAQRVSGDIRPLLDWRGALAFGAAVGIIAGLVRRGRRGG